MKKCNDSQMEVLEFIEALKNPSKQKLKQYFPNLINILQPNILISKILDMIANEERKHYLDENEFDIGNGFYQRELKT